MAFDIDADGILHVSAKDLATSKEQKIRIEAQSGLREDEVQRMLKDAELHAEEDRKKREEAETRNEADGMAFRAEKALRDYKDKLPKEVVDDVQMKIDVVRKALESSDLGKIKMAKQELEEHMQHIGEAMSKGAKASAEGPQAGPQAQSAHQEQQEQQPGKDNNIEEAEVEIIDDENKQQ